MQQQFDSATKKFIYQPRKEISYSYTNEPSGYGVSGYKKNDDNYLKNTYRYNVEANYPYSKKTFTYNGKHELIKVSDSGNNHRIDKEFSYDESGQLKQKITEDFEVIGGSVGSNSIRKVEDFTYDDYGNLLSYTSPIANRNSNIPLDDKNTTEYTYYTDRYHAPKTKQWYKDATTKCSEEYSVDAKGNIIKKIENYKEDNISKQRITDYTYDSYGNLISETIDNKYSMNFEYGTDIDGVNHKGAYLTREYKIADDKILEKKYAYDFSTGNKVKSMDENGNVITYTYDETNKLTATTYPNKDSDRRIYFENRIYENSVTKNLTVERWRSNNKVTVIRDTTLQSEGVKKYLMYISKDSLIRNLEAKYNLQDLTWDIIKTQHSDKLKDYIQGIALSKFVPGNYFPITDYSSLSVAEQGSTIIAQYKVQLFKPNKNYAYDYTIDIFDNIKAIVKNEYSVDFDKTTNSFSAVLSGRFPVKEFEYDLEDNVTKEIDANGRYKKNTYDSLGRLVEESFNDTNNTKLKSNKIEYQITNDQGMPYLEIYTDEEGYNKKLYYDIVNRLVKEEATPDNSEYYSESYTYDNVGNRVEESDFKNNATYYTYDELGRIVSKTNALGKEEKYYYDGLNNIVRIVNPKGKEIEIEYDSAGRPIRRKAPHGINDVAITRYLYDNVGNLVKEILPKDYDASKDNATQINTLVGEEYTYDKLNRLVKIDSRDKKLTVDREFDLNGNLIKETLTDIRMDKDQETMYEYNHQNKISKIINPYFETKEFKYDKIGNIISYTDEEGNTIKIEYTKDYKIETITYPDGGVVRYSYDNLGREKTYTNQLGYTTVYDYDGLGRISTVKNPRYNQALPEKNIKTFEYDENGNVISETDFRGNIVAYRTYDKLNRLIEEKTPIEEIGNITHYNTRIISYDDIGNIAKIQTTGTKDINAIRNIEYSYYDNNLVKSQILNGNSTVEYEYDKNGNLKKEKRQRTPQEYDIVKYQYDNENRLTEEIKLVDKNLLTAEEVVAGLIDNEYSNKIQIKTKYDYDAFGNITKIYSPKEFKEGIGEYTVSKRYDYLNRLIEESFIYNEQTKSRSYKYDDVGNLIEETDPKGNAKHYVYDEMNRVVLAIDQLNNTINYKYDKLGNKIEIINSKNQKMIYEYDDLGRLCKTKNNRGEVIEQNIYDENSNLIKKIDAKGYLSGTDNNTRYGIEYIYNINNRLIKTIDPMAKEKNKYSYEYKYNQFGELTEEIDALGNIKKYSYDNLGRLSGITDANSITVSYIYDKKGNRTRMLDGNNNPTQYIYGEFGLLKEVIDAENKRLTYKYDLNLNCIEQTDKKGNRINYSYDNRNLLLSKKNIQTNDTIEYKYDEVGNKIQMIDETGTTDYVYDDTYRLKNILKNNENQINYSYDILGNVVKVVDKLGNATKYEYDDLNRLDKVEYSTGSLNNIVKYSYDINGNKAGITYSSGTKVGYEYNKNNKITRVTNEDNNNQKISEYTYEYDLLGRKKSLTDEYGITSYEYDKAGRLKKLIAPKKNESYDFDGAGNIIKIVEELKNAVGVQTKITEMSYTPANKLQSKTINGINQNVDTILPKLEFDGFDRLKKVTDNINGEEIITEYKHDGNNLRVEKTIKKGTTELDTTNYIYNGQHVILTTDKTGNLKERYIRGLEYLGRIDSSGNHGNYIYNAHGDVTGIINQNGIEDNKYHYDAFGNLLENIEKYENEIRYSGEFFDKEAGMYYLRARFYDPRNRRFVNEDSYWGEATNTLSLNLYTYCHNDPINFIDPSGHWIESDYRLNKKDQEKIIKYTDKWYSAKSNAEKKKWHRKAKEVRERAKRKYKHKYKDDHNENLNHMKYAKSTKNKWFKRTREKVNKTRSDINKYREKDIRWDESFADVGMSNVESTNNVEGTIEVNGITIVSRYTQNPNLSFLDRAKADLYAFDEENLYGVLQKLKILDKSRHIDDKYADEFYNEIEFARDEVRLSNIFIVGMEASTSSVTIKETGKTVDDILDGATAGRATKGRSSIYDKVGDYNDALDDFNSLNPKNVKDIDIGKVGTLDDGRTVIVRTKSSDGRITLEIQKGKNKTKIRYSK